MILLKQNYGSELDWSLVTENSEVNLDFETFVQLVNRVLNKHAPTKVIEKKGNKVTSKPCMARGIKIFCHQNILRKIKISREFGKIHDVMSS